MLLDLPISYATTKTDLPEMPPVEAACPVGLPEGTRCFRGQDSAGAHYMIVVPAQWSGVLVMHAHGGPPLEIKATRVDEDIQRWSVVVRLGHAWAASVFQQAGFAVRSAVEDTERLRRIFCECVAKPRRTLLHGQSWGGVVAAKAAEIYAESWDGLLLTSSAVGGPLAYDFRLDLRVIYQYLCNDHPRSDEPSYPLSIGLPREDSRLTLAELAARADESLGVLRPAEQRSPEQARKLKTIVDVLKIPEAAVIDQLRWGTWALRDLVVKHGGSFLCNDTVRYSGSDDDATLNASVQRYRADPSAYARFLSDSDYSGRISVPVLTVHGIKDQTCLVEVHDTLRSRMRTMGYEQNLVQTFVDSDKHSYFGDEIYPPLIEALLGWIEDGSRPTPHQIAERCRALIGDTSAACGFRPDFVPGPLASRVHPR
jgi:pimeloyl-ACP methyl ester carboxylesterase